MQYYLAPMEGITRYLYRNIHREHFATFDKYFTPFISMSRKIPPKSKRDILPENNSGIVTVPQIMVANAHETLYLTSKLSPFGYSDFNINAGCPSGTVVTKLRGAGLLKDLDNFKSFLDELFSSELTATYSIKLRMGWENTNEWEAVSRLIGNYPFSEVIIHGRVRSEFYNGNAHREALTIARENISSPICYNGDVYSIEDVESLKSEYPWLDQIMIGRGILRNPGLLDEIKTGQKVSNDKIYAFMDDLFNQYLSLFENDINTLYHIKELWYYLSFTHPEKEKDLKIIKKTKSILEYKEAVKRILL